MKDQSLTSPSVMKRSYQIVSYQSRTLSLLIAMEHYYVLETVVNVSIYVRVCVYMCVCCVKRELNYRDVGRQLSCLD